MGEHGVTTRFVDHVRERLQRAGLAGAELVSCSPEPVVFDNAEAVFRAGSLLLRLVRERGQEFLDLAASAAPQRFHQFGDLELALGWTKVPEVLARKDPEDLDLVLARVASRFAELESVLSADRLRGTEAKIEQAARERGEAFLAQLRGD